MTENELKKIETRVDELRSDLRKIENLKWELKNLTDIKDDTVLYLSFPHSNSYHICIDDKEAIKRIIDFTKENLNKQIEEAEESFKNKTF